MKLAKPKHERPLSLPDLLNLNRNAVTVYAALRWMAGDKRQLGTVRKRIREVCHLSPEVITDAMKALKESNWLTFSYGSKPGTNFRWYRITFTVAEFFPTIKNQGQALTKAKSAPVRGTPLEGETPSPLLEREASSSSAPIGASSSSPTGSRNQIQKHDEPAANTKSPADIAFVDEDGIQYVRLSNGALRPVSMRRGA